MFSTFTKLFNRTFIVGYLMPAVLFYASSYKIFNDYGFLSPQLKTYFSNSFAIGFSIFFIAIFLLGINREVIRFLEGYGGLNPLRVFRFTELKRFNSTRIEFDGFTQKKNENMLNVKERIRRNKLSKKLSIRFPDKEEFVLPTSFGNTIRAFEVYSRKMYGLDAIPGWPRLLTVIPEEVLSLVNDSKSKVDYWINLLFLSVVFLFEYIICIFSVNEIYAPWLVITTILLIPFAYWRGCSAAVQWGQMVKACFDTFLADLHVRIRLPKAATRREEAKNWLRVSQAMVYSHPESLLSIEFPNEEED